MSGRRDLAMENVRRVVAREQRWIYRELREAGVSHQLARTRARGVGHAAEHAVFWARHGPLLEALRRDGR